MIKNNRHDTYVKNEPDIIHDVIVKGGHTLTEEESFYFNIDEFSKNYEKFLEITNLPPLPLQVEEGRRGRKTIFIHPKALERMSTMELEEYRAAFTERFSDGVDGQQLGEYVTVGKNSERQDVNRSPDYFSAARQKNADYAAASALLLFDDKINEYPDDYGWIENRQQLFFAAMDELCDCYALPRLRIVFDKEDVPYFDAPDEEIDEVKKFYHERKKALGDLANSLKNTSKSKEEYETAAGIGFSALRGTWQMMENKERDFHEQTLRYVEHFASNGRDMLTLNGGHLMMESESDIDAQPSKGFKFPMPNYN